MLVKYFVSLLTLCQDPLFPSCAMFPRKYLRSFHFIDQSTKKDKETKLKLLTICIKP